MNSISPDTTIVLNNSLTEQYILIINQVHAQWELCLLKDHDIIHYQIFNSEAEIHHSAILNYSYQAVHVISIAKNSVFIPEKLMEDANCSNILNYVSLQAHDSLKYDHLKNAGIYAAFVTEAREWLEKLQKINPKINYLDQVTAFLRQIPSDENAFSIHFLEKACIIVYYDNSKLKIAKYFNINSDQELFYYVNLVLQELKIKSLDKLYCSGNTSTFELSIQKLASQFSIEKRAYKEDKIQDSVIAVSLKDSFQKYLKPYICALLGEN